MSDDKRRAGTKGDADRAYAHRHSATPARGVVASGVVVVEIDEELTPPPQMPPLDEEIDIASVLREHSEAIEKVWASRNLNENVITIGKDVAALTAMMGQFVVPAVKNLQGRLEVIERANEANRGKQERFFENEWPAAMKTLESIETHGARVEKDIGRVEKDVQRVEHNLDTHIKRGDEQLHALNAEITELKKSKSDAETRLRKLEDFELTVKSKVALVSALLGGGGAGIVLVVKQLLGG